jgi:hypothetical protein
VDAFFNLSALDQANGAVKRGLIHELS